ncbi:hypothetical protein HMPREF0666_00282 [Prevotella sp. C561]|nr:hypothetical protein HMPREF0666_00282 [Prevotella sp. C561]
MRSLYPLYRGISVITPLPFGGGEGGGASWGQKGVGCWVLGDDVMCCHHYSL